MYWVCLGGARKHQHTLFGRRLCVQHRVFATPDQYDAYEAALAHACTLDDVLQDEDRDNVAIQQALQPAWAALDAGVHKKVMRDILVL